MLHTADFDLQYNHIATENLLVHTAIKPATSLTYYFIKTYYMNKLLNKTRVALLVNNGYC